MFGIGTKIYNKYNLRQIKKQKAKNIVSQVKHNTKEVPPNWVTVELENEKIKSEMKALKDQNDDWILHENFDSIDIDSDV